METPLHPNVLLAKIVELGGGFVKNNHKIWIYHYKQTQQNYKKKELKFKRNNTYKSLQNGF